MTIRVENLFANLPGLSESEQSLSLFENHAVKIERIVSQSHSSPPGFWYDQDEDAWVIVVQRRSESGIRGGRARPDERGRSCGDSTPCETSSSADRSKHNLAGGACSRLSSRRGDGGTCR